MHLQSSHKMYKIKNKLITGPPSAREQGKTKEQSYPTKALDVCEGAAAYREALRNGPGAGSERA